ncbi:NAD(P)-dependent oxidoreductase [uncultured Erythrobacter sp.]|uniref:NAD(P)-dependent oxidoreductase n=1 Tax=uncultured Erythrobacter sp. TaxID=263913 RepID=UPI002630DA47|nr:NAD(P)-dependent oxidoreductase [uncultured Erythrobacter sp.]
MANDDRGFSRRISVIGLGIIGGSVARHLVDAGWDVGGHDLSEKAKAEASSNGVTILNTPAALAAHSDLVLTSLPSAKAAVAVFDTLLEHATGPMIVAELSTLALEDKFALRDRVCGTQCAILDCPISGTGAQAASRDIAIYASGESAAIDRMEPAFDAISRKLIRMGEFGQGSKMKLVANLLVAIHNVASAEAMALGQAAGLEPNAIIEAVQAGAGNSRIFELRAPMMAERVYEPATMKLDVWDKDMQAIAAFAAELGSAVPLLDASLPLYDAATQRHPQSDTAAVFEALRALTNSDLGAGS